MSNRICDCCKTTMNADETFCRNCGASTEHQVAERMLSLSPAANVELKKGSCGSISYIDVIVIFVILGILAAIAVPNYRKCYRQQARDKACFANMRVIMGAIEMYNMDHESLISTTLDDPTKKDSILVKEHYLKSPLSPPDVNCNYKIMGDITNKGFICCDVHGTIESPTKVE